LSARWAAYGKEAGARCAPTLSNFESPSDLALLPPGLCRVTPVVVTGDATNVISPADSLHQATARSSPGNSWKREQIDWLQRFVSRATQQQASVTGTSPIEIHSRPHSCTHASVEGRARRTSPGNDPVVASGDDFRDRVIRTRRSDILPSQRGTNCTGREKVASAPHFLEKKPRKVVSRCYRLCMIALEIKPVCLSAGYECAEEAIRNSC
jgi:hypothetical protein